MIDTETCGGNVLKSTISNFLSTEDLCTIHQQIHSIPRWQYHHQKIDPDYNIVGDSEGAFIWRYRLMDGMKTYNADDPSTFLSNQQGWREQIHPVWSKIFSKIEEIAGPRYTLMRYAVNGTMMGQLGIPHTDVPTSCENGTTWLLYLNPVWDPMWGGHTTFFKNADLEESLSLPYEPGKMVEFWGKFWHIAQPPNVPNLLRLAMVVIGRYD